MVISSFNDKQCVLVCFDLFEGGSETTSTTLSWSVLYIASHPEIQQKCQIEIDEEIGSRPPTIEDVPNLPYVMACLMETQRLSIMAPASLPHYLTKVCTKLYITTFKARKIRHLLLKTNKE
jgi:cytochrome P450